MSKNMINDIFQDYEGTTIAEFVIEGNGVKVDVNDDLIEEYGPDKMEAMMYAACQSHIEKIVTKDCLRDAMLMPKEAAIENAERFIREAAEMMAEHVREKAASVIEDKVFTDIRTIIKRIGENIGGDDR